MILGNKRRLGRKIEEISVGEKLKLTEKIEDKDLLLYLGLTNDSNPLYIQHDYAAQSQFEKPIVPTIMLTGIVTSATSKYLPGPGSHVKACELEFPKPVYHYTIVDFLLEVIEVRESSNEIIVKIEAWNEDEEVVVKGFITVIPRAEINQLMVDSLDNF